MKKLIWFASIFSLVLTTSCKPSSEKNQSQNDPIAAGDTLKGEISFSGAFALYPMVVKWADEFRKLHPNVRIDISGGGAGKGMTDALAKVVDLGMVSREIYEVEAQKGALGFAVVKDAVVATINVANPHFDEICKKGLTKATAAALWDNQYATYGDLLGIESTIPVHVYTRSDACGAAETWAIWFGKRQEQLQGTAVYGDPGVSAAVQKDRVGIGYNNIAYAYDMRSHKPYEGLAVIPLDVNENGQIDEDEKFYENSADLIKAIGEGRYPSPPVSPLGKDVNYYSVPMYWNLSAGINYLTDTDSRLQIRKMFELLADEQNYPLIFHCNIGTDRTGLYSFLINALLGVKIDDLYRDYLFSNFGSIGGSRQPSGLKELIDTVITFEGTTFAQKTENCLLDIGITHEQIAFLRNQLTEK